MLRAETWAASSVPGPRNAASDFTSGRAALLPCVSLGVTLGPVQHLPLFNHYPVHRVRGNKTAPGGQSETMRPRPPSFLKLVDAGPLEAHLGNSQTWDCTTLVTYRHTRTGREDTLRCARCRLLSSPPALQGRGIWGSVLYHRRCGTCGQCHKRCHLGHVYIT